MDLPPELLVVTRAQSGVVTRQQALASGLSPGFIRHALRRDGPWRRIVYGVYATFTGPIQDRHRIQAALLRAGPLAAVTGIAACLAYGLKYVPDGPRIELLVPQHVDHAPIAIATIRRTRHMPEVRDIRGIPCAAPERAALDAARHAQTLRNARAVVCEVVQRGLITTDRLLAEHARMDPRGLALVDQAVADVRAGVRSAPEAELRELVTSSTLLPEVRWNQPLPDPRASDIIPDGCIPEVKLVLEVEGVEWHQIGDGPARTDARRARLASLGWRVYPVSPHRIRAEPTQVLTEIEAAADPRNLGDVA